MQCCVPSTADTGCLCVDQTRGVGVWTQCNWVCQVNHSEVRDGQQTLTHFYSTESRNQASQPVTTLVGKTKRECMICLS